MSKISQQVFGSAGQLDDPIIDLSAGYHTFFPTSNARSLMGYIETGATKGAATSVKLPEGSRATLGAGAKGTPREVMVLNMVNFRVIT